MDSYVKRATGAWGKIIHSEYGHKCAMCGRVAEPYNYNWLEAHHIGGRASLAMKFYTELGILLCTDCHKVRAKAPHIDQTAFLEWLNEEYPAKYNLYTELKYKLVSHHDIDIKQICRDLEERAAYAA